MKALTLALLWPAMIVSTAESPRSPWKLDNNPVLMPGVIGEWDDWAIATPTILKVSGKWWMLYEGVRFDRNGVRSAFGVAQSDDGLAWRKHSQNPLFTPAIGETQSCSSPCATRWRDAFWVVYVVNEDPFRAGGTPVAARLARSEDGLIWHDVPGVRLPISFTFPYPFRPCLYGEDSLLHLWWIGPRGKEDEALFHSVSRDGETWSAANEQPVKEIDNREICCARIYPSGNYYILSYVAYDQSKKHYFGVTKTSRDARSWTANGPPEFPLLTHSEHTVPWFVFESGRARLFYSTQREDNTQELRSGYCEKKNYATQ